MQFIALDHQHHHLHCRHQQHQRHHCHHQSKWCVTSLWGEYGPPRHLLTIIHFQDIAVKDEYAPKKHRNKQDRKQTLPISLLEEVYWREGFVRGKGVLRIWTEGKEDKKDRLTVGQGEHCESASWKSMWGPLYLFWQNYHCRWSQHRHIRYLWNLRVTLLDEIITLGLLRLLILDQSKLN